jgi:hypothetical protein
VCSRRFVAVKTSCDEDRWPGTFALDDVEGCLPARPSAEDSLGEGTVSPKKGRREKEQE